MSREKDFVSEITNLTDEGHLTWTNVSAGKYSEYILQFPSAYQAFTSKYEKGGRTYNLLLVHKKIPGINPDFEVPEEQQSIELIVIFDGRLISTITEYDVDERYLGALASSVSEHNEDTDKLFN